MTTKNTTAVGRYYEAAYELDDLRMQGDSDAIEAKEIEVDALAAQAREVLSQERRAMMAIDAFQEITGQQL